MTDFHSLDLVLFGEKEEYAIAAALTSTEEDAASTRQALHALYDIAEHYALEGDLWENFIAWLLIHDENPYSLSHEHCAAGKGSLYAVALQDAAILRKLFFTQTAFDLHSAYHPSEKSRFGNLRNIGAEAVALAGRLREADSDEAFLDTVTDFYHRHGVGLFGLNCAFYLDDDHQIVPVTNFDGIRLSDLYGYETQKGQIYDNTDAFVLGKNANNVLLYGDSGTGKSTCVKAILNEFSPAGLRMIQIQKHQLTGINPLIDMIKQRNYRFVLYMDDLSFEDFETEYKYLKAIIEGGLEPKPDNMLIYATSNRRHLVRESWKEREGDEIHVNDTKQEKLSLASRFGVSVYFERPNQDGYFDIVRYLAEKSGLHIPEDKLIAEARKWSVLHAGTSGRVAQQFVDYIAVHGTEL